MGNGYSNWPESNWASNTVDIGKASKIRAGVDIGTTSAQAAVFADDELCAWANIRTGSDFRKAADTVRALTLDALSIDVKDVEAVTATGFGAKNVSYATGVMDEISCHAKGARFMFGPTAMTVVDLGGQSTHAIRLFDWDRVRAFQTNDKCATGMGRHIEVVSELLGVPITEIGDRSLGEGKDPEPVSTTCYNFAYPETIGLLRQGYKEDVYSERDVLAAYLFAVSWRIMSTIGKIAPLDIGDIVLEQDVAFTGGLAKNSGIVKRLERELKIETIKSKYDPQLAGAIGAALLS